MVELGRALGRLPDRLVVVGVEAAQFEHGAPLSAGVAAAVPVAAAAVCDAVAATLREETSHVPR
jgi:hydrogenase maturation protease